MDAVGPARPEVDDEAEVTPRDHRYPVSTRVEHVTDGTVVVRPSVGDFADQEVVRVGDHPQVFWRDATTVWALPVQVAVVERGAAPRWHLPVLGPAEAVQRREAVRARRVGTRGDGRGPRRVGHSHHAPARRRSPWARPSRGAPTPHAPTDSASAPH